MIYSFLAIICMMLVVIGLHELGHAAVAKYFHVAILRISIGFGKALYAVKDKRGIEWVIGWLPLGGAVHLLNSRIQSVHPNQLKYCFDQQRIGVRCTILLAGGVVNGLVAWVALTGALMIGTSYYTPIIGRIIPHSMAEQMGVHRGDRVIAVDGQLTPSWQTASMALIGHLGQASVLLTLQEGKQVARQIKLDLRPGQYVNQKGSLFQRIGFLPQLNAQNLYSSPTEAIGVAMIHAAYQIGQWIMFYGLVLKQLLSGLLPFSMLLGPIGLLMVSMDSMLHGLSTFLTFLGTLSVAVGVANYLPLPGLDGGSIMYALLEKIRGKPISIALEVLLYRLAVIGFSVLLVQLILNDVARYFL